MLNYVLENPNVDIDSLPVGDLVDPTLYFYSNVGASASLDYIAFDGDTYGVPYNTLDGFTFSTTISLAQSGISGSITRYRLIDLLVDYVEDNRDGYMYMNTYNLIITGTSGVVTTIIETGTYSLTFDFSDIAQNYLDGVIVDLNITA